jgi:Flp pilus assembly protein TadG
MHRTRMQQPASRVRSGSIIVLSAFVMVIVMAFAAFTIDIGYISLCKGQLQSAVDAATLSGVMEFDPSNPNQSAVKTNVENQAIALGLLNDVGNQGGLVLNASTDIMVGNLDIDPSTGALVYNWGTSPYNLLKVTGRVTFPTFFAGTINHDSVTLNSSTIATYQPRDMMLVLDYSGSMNNDTEFKSAPTIGISLINSSIDTMWTELGSPSYGGLPYTPAYVTVAGVPEDIPSNIPHVTVEYKGDHVYVTSTMDLDIVKLYDKNGYYATYDNLSGTSGTFWDNRKIRKVWVESAGNTNLSPEAWGEKFEFYDDDVAGYLGLNAVTYPYASGSWTDFVDYCNDDSDCGKMNYQYKYGMRCLINYWNEKKPQYSQTADLWEITTQPLNAAKNASDLLIDYVNEVEADDRIGLSIYTHTNSNGAILESGLTHDILDVKPLYRDRQAGHYDNMTNIAGGIKVARLELEANIRPVAFPVIILMTDGVANRPTPNPEAAAMAEAALCATAGIRILTVSLGLGADQDLMQDIADETGGKHFNVPGGGTIAEYEAQLMAVFQKIAADRPLKILPAE